MKLKALITAEQYAELAEPLKELYAKTEEGYALEVEDSELKSKLDEFRTNNRKLFKELEKLKADLKKYDGVDVEKYEQTLEKLKQFDGMEDAELLKAGKLDEVVEKRTKAMRDEFAAKTKALETQRTELLTERDALRGRMGKLLIDTAVTEHVGKVGQIRKGALPDILRRAATTFIINEKGEMVPNTEGGSAFDKEGNPFTPETWAKSLLADAPYFFESSGGGGAAGSEKTGQPPVSLDDPVEFGRRAKDIASGKVVVK